VDNKVPEMPVSAACLALHAFMVASLRALLHKHFSVFQKPIVLVVAIFNEGHEGYPDGNIATASLQVPTHFVKQHRIGFVSFYLKVGWRLAEVSA